MLQRDKTALTTHIDFLVNNLPLVAGEETILTPLFYGQEQWPGLQHTGPWSAASLAPGRKIPDH